MKTAVNCRICNAELAERFILREMMFGMRDEFTYSKCPDSGCIQIIEVPVNIEKYYPDYYMAFTQFVPRLKRLPVFKRIVKNLRMRRKYRMSKNSVLSFLKPLGTMPGVSILDIGCGKGEKICSLYNLGFERITGVDKFIPQEIDYGNDVKVLKKDLSELDSNAYDILMMHHVLEHVDDQVAELEQCYRLLKKDGVLLICIPLVGEAWDKYGTNWVQLDAPRHFVLHTLKSMDILAKKTGFSIKKTIFDSNEFQFWGSELYQKDIPLTMPVTHEWYPVEKNLSANQIQQFKAGAELLNRRQRGDMARFYLYKN